MKKLYLKLICAAAIVAALPLAGCSSMGGNQTTQDEDIITMQQADESCPDCENEDCPDGDCKDGNCKDGDCDNDGCPDCPDGDCKEDCKGKKKNKHRKHRGHGKNSRTRTVAPKGKCGKHRKPPVHPKKPVEPPKDDIILPDPPVEGEQPESAN